MPADLEGLPPALPTRHAAKLLDCAPGTLWRAAVDHGGIVDADGTVIVRPFHLGRALRWPREQLLELLRPIGGGDGLAEVVPPGAERQPCESQSNGGGDNVS